MRSVSGGTSSSKISLEGPQSMWSLLERPQTVKCFWNVPRLWFHYGGSSGNNLLLVGPQTVWILSGGSSSVKTPSRGSSDYVVPLWMVLKQHSLFGGTSDNVVSVWMVLI